MIYTDQIQVLLPNDHFLDCEQRTNGVEMDYGDFFLCALMEAIPKVSAIYFKCSDANRKVAEDYLDNTQLINAAFTFGERAFCYELYHQLRLQIDTPENRTLILHGELQKQLLKDMTEKCTGARRLDKKYIPDFLLHSPGNFDNQEVMMEVKSDPKLKCTQIYDDLKKIDQFISRYNYKTGVFLAVNISEEALTDELRKNKIALRNDLDHQDKFHIVVNESPDKEVFQAPLSDILK